MPFERTFAYGEFRDNIRSLDISQYISQENLKILHLKY